MPLILFISLLLGYYQEYKILINLRSLSTRTILTATVYLRKVISQSVHTSDQKKDKNKNVSIYLDLSEVENP